MSIENAARRARRGYTLWELTMVLAVMAIAATLAAPAFARLGTEQPTRGADQMVLLLQEARKAAIKYNATVTLRIDPKTLKYHVDTATVAGASTLAEGTLDLGMGEKLESDQLRLTYVFRPSGAAYADPVLLRGGEIPLFIRVDPWSGVASADTL